MDEAPHLYGRHGRQTYKADIQGRHVSNRVQWSHHDPVPDALLLMLICLPYMSQDPVPEASHGAPPLVLRRPCYVQSSSRQRPRPGRLPRRRSRSLPPHLRCTARYTARYTARPLARGAHTAVCVCAYVCLCMIYMFLYKYV